MTSQTWATLSDLTFEAAAAGYLVALVCHGVELASRRTPIHAAHPAAAAAGVPAQRTAGSVALLPAGAAGSVIGVVVAAPAASWGDRFARAAVVVTVVGFTAQVISLVTRGLAAQRVPWGNMYEFASMITAAAVAGWLVVLARTRARGLGLFIMFPVVVLVFLAGTVLYTQASQLVPALQSYWLVIHVLAVSLSSGVLMFSGVASAAYLLRSRHETPTATATAGGSDQFEPGTATAPLLAKLPSLEMLDRIAYRTAIIAFPVYTFAVIAGALWAEAAWGRYWGWDPKETCAFVTWVIYAAYLHARATAGWRGRRSAWISLLGLAAILFNLFFINMVVSGLHSYAGLN